METTSPKVILHATFASMYETFEVNTSAIKHVLGEIGLGNSQIIDFDVTFENGRPDSMLEMFYGDEPPLGWFTHGENGVHVNGLDHVGLLLHSSPATYARTILHEIGHVDSDINPRKRLLRSEESRADSFAKRWSHLFGDLVEFRIDTDRVETYKHNIHKDDIVYRERSYRDLEQRVAKLTR